MMIKLGQIKRYQAVLLILILGLTACKNTPVYDITESEFLAHVSYLASPELEGRYSGTQGDKLAADYIRSQFESYGLTLLENKGLQEFQVLAGVSLGDENVLQWENLNAEISIDFIPFSYSGSIDTVADWLYVGFGIEAEIDSASWSDFPAENEIKNKWIIAFRGDPDVLKRNSRFDGYSDDRSKAVLLKDKGAAGLILISPSFMETDDQLTPLVFDKSASNVGIPVVQITRAFAKKMFALANPAIVFEELEEMLLNETPNRVTLAGKGLSLQIELLLNEVITQNVVAAIFPSGTNYNDSCLVVGAHYDHLGWGGPGSGSRHPDSLAIHFGADDNASGVAGLIELAGYFANKRDSLKYTIVFVAFGAEELGILGSKYFVKHLPSQFSGVHAMINFDMIGRLDSITRSIAIGGTGTFLEADSILKQVEAKHELRTNFSPEGFGASDHASFYVADIPVLFISTGAHPDYHTSRDAIDKINAKGACDVLHFTKDIIWDFNQHNKALSFRESGPKEGGHGGRNYKVTLGIMPDFTSSSNSGLGIDYVRQGGPAYKVGMEKGDVIVAIDGMPVENINDYMVRLKKLKLGETITVDCRRGEEIKVFIVQL